METWLLRATKGSTVWTIENKDEKIVTVSLSRIDKLIGTIAILNRAKQLTKYLTISKKRLI